MCDYESFRQRDVSAVVLCMQEIAELKRRLEGEVEGGGREWRVERD